ncbi:unnamed protein product [Adineta steineri]|uniref:Uncharacterized protein n=1 Tax=Adineta steineri TaxID=433720 RepID=A0A814T7B8_9BILA|nr:unnamed protein product [Adineta steineri]CAF1157649.1 unnamed protein product [Adineta steineri]CAF3626288.1 unnamed protein product [Adineta steineri]CAF3729758.1 unnamed protein product [Adineta steineri]
MQSTSAILLILVSIGVLCIANVGGDRCLCSCCVGMGCKVIGKPPLSIPSCENNACSAKCKQTYVADCDSPQSQSVNICISGASIIFSRYTIFTTFILAITAMKGLRV